MNKPASGTKSIFKPPSPTTCVCGWGEGAGGGGGAILLCKATGFVVHSPVAMLCTLCCIHWESFFIQPVCILMPFWIPCDLLGSSHHLSVCVYVCVCVCVCVCVYVCVSK